MKMIIKFLKKIFGQTAQSSKSEREKLAVEKTANQYISAKDQDRAKDFAKVEVSKQELEHAQENKKLTNTEEELRLQVISALYEGILLDEEYKNHCIESFARSTMTLEDIKKHVENVREFQNRNNYKTTQSQQGTKLPQRSTERKDQDFIY